MGRKVLGAIVLVLALGAVGCGGSSSSPSGGGSGPSTAFIGQADKICKDSRKEVDQAFRTVGRAYKEHRATRQQASSRLRAATAAVQRKMTSQLAALEAPPTVKARYARYMAARRKSIVFQGKLRTSDPHVVESSRALIASRGDLAKQIGFKFCS